MNLSEIIAEIESTEFAVRFSVLSGFSTVLSGMDYDDTVGKLIAALQDNFDNHQIILERITKLLSVYKPDYMHPHDEMVTAYLYALHRVNSLGVLDRVLDRIIDIREFWWARKMAQYILEKQAARTTHNQQEILHHMSRGVKLTIDIKTDATTVRIPA